MFKIKILFFTVTLAFVISACEFAGNESIPAPEQSLLQDNYALNSMWYDPSGLADHISIAGTMAANPSAVMDANGNAVVVWHQGDGTGKNRIYESEYTGGIWNNPSSLSDSISLAGNDAYNAEVAMDDAGNKIIVWGQFNGVDWSVYMAEYIVGTGWTTPTSIATGFVPQVAMDNSGNALIVWGQWLGAAERFFKLERRNGGAWSAPTQVSTTGLFIGTVSAAISTGNHQGIIVWTQKNSVSGKLLVYKSEDRSGNGTGWTTPAQISTSSTQEANETRVAIDSSGNTVVTWYQCDVNGSQIYKKEYRGGAWNVAAQISPSGTEAYNPIVAMDDNGNSIIVWSQKDVETPLPARWQIFKSEYRSAVWVNPSSVTDNISLDGYDAVDPTVAMDNAGNAVIVWAQNNGTKSAMYRREYRGGSWSAQPALNGYFSPAGQNANTPIVVMDKVGNTALSVWKQLDGSKAQIYKSEYR